MSLNPPEREIRAELACIFAHRLFSAAPLQRTILALIVDETLVGRGKTLKEEVLAEQLGFKDYDKTKQSLVRADVRKIRQNLAKYYVAVTSARVRIDVPRHAFAATFNWMDAAGSSPDNLGAGKAVRPELGSEKTAHERTAKALVGTVWWRASAAETTALTASFLILLGVFAPLTVKGSFGSATLVLILCAISLILILATIPNLTLIRVASSLFMLAAMAYFPSAWTLNHVMGTVVNMDVLPPSAVYPFVTGIKFIPLYVLVCVYWVILGFYNDAGFESHPAVGKVFWILAFLFLTAWLLAGSVTGDYNIWQAKLPGRWTVLFGYTVTLVGNVAALLFAYRFFRQKSITSYQPLFVLCFITYFVVAIGGSVVDHEYNKINACCLDKRRPNIYKTVRSPASAVSAISSAEIGPGLGEMLRDREFRRILSEENFYRQDFDEGFQKSAVMFGYRDPRSASGSLDFQIIRFPKEVVEILGFRLSTTASMKR